jgi:glycosyltransferase involved in cell wall biosynthesis
MYLVRGKFMKDIVIIPTYNRPELLYLCIEQLSKCEGIETKQVIIHEDDHDDKPKHFSRILEILEVIRFAKRVLPHVSHVRVSHSNYGSSYNFIEGFRHAYNSDAKYVYHIEDDCLITPDYFRYAEEAHKLCPDAFVVCGNARPQSRTGESDLVHLSYWFQTFALSFRRENLAKILLPKYEGYCLSRNFEFDTYIMNWMVRNEEYSVSPMKERVFTFGHYSYHMPGQRLPGNLQEVIELTRQATKDPSLLSGSGYAKDFIPYSEPDLWTSLRKRSSLGQKLK